MKESPQLGDGYARFANDVLESLFRARMPSANAYRVLLWIGRNSYGWNRKATKPVRINDIAFEVDMNKSSVHLALQMLLDAKVIERDDQGRLSIQKKWKKWDQSVQPTERGEAEAVQRNGRTVRSTKPKFSPLDPIKDKDTLNTEKEKQIAQTTALQTGVDKKKPMTGLVKVMRGFKEAKGIDADDAAWDALHFKRFARAAADLLKVFRGNADAAIVYTLKKGDELDSKQLLGWGLEAVARAAATDPNVMNFMGGEDGSEHKPVGSDRVDGPRSTGRFTSSRSLAGDTLRSLGSPGVRPEETRYLGSDDDDFSGDQD